LEAQTPPQVIVAQMGAREHYAVPVMLYEAGMLGHFFTDAYSGPGSWLSPAVKGLAAFFPRWAPAARTLGRRAALPPDKVTSFNLLGLSFAFKLSRARGEEERREIYLWGAKRFCREILQHPGPLGRGQALYAFNGAALELFAFGAAQKMKLILNQISPSLYEERLLAEESARWPDWETEPARVHEDEAFARGREEWRRADTIIVNSIFTRQALETLGADPAKIRVVPLGIDTRRFHPPETPRKPGMVKFLFLGAVGLRKGIPYALEAFRRLSSKNVVFTVAGGIDSRFRPEKLREYSGQIKVMGPIPRREVLRAYQGADVFVFPTISDGFGLTQLEAMASGLPVIATPNCGAVVRDGVDGFIVPIRDSEALAEKMEVLAENPGLLASMSQNARERARDFSLEKYRERLISAILDSST
jgi:glycosyltransferase involved in cell wall biosynthesis